MTGSGGSVASYTRLEIGSPRTSYAALIVLESLHLRFVVVGLVWMVKQCEAAKRFLDICRGGQPLDLQEVVVGPVPVDVQRWSKLAGHIGKSLFVLPHCGWDETRKLLPGRHGD